MKHLFRFYDIIIVSSNRYRIRSPKHSVLNRNRRRIPSTSTIVVLILDIIYIDVVSNEAKGNCLQLYSLVGVIVV
jgi:hypothetical protein